MPRSKQGEKEMGARKRLGQRVSSLSASPGGPLVLAGGGGSAGSQGGKAGREDALLAGWHS